MLAKVRPAGRYSEFSQGVFTNLCLLCPKYLNFMHDLINWRPLLYVFALIVVLVEYNI